MNKPFSDKIPSARIIDQADTPKRFRFGVLAGTAMALSAAFAFITARWGILAGLGVMDIIFVRFLVAGFLMIPFLMYAGVSSLAGIGWRRGIILALLSGPPFALLNTGGFSLAPLAHGAVISPPSVTILCTIGAALFLGERLKAVHIFGATIVLAGILLIGTDGIIHGSERASDNVWLGDLLFFASSVLWAAFTLLLRHWRIPAWNATMVVAVLSSLAMTPAYLVMVGPTHLLSLPIGQLALQGVMQGAVLTVFTMTAYSLTVQMLGVSRAVLFPAILPATTILIGIPILGEIPSALQFAGMALATIGLLVALFVPLLLDRRAVEATLRGG